VESLPPSRSGRGRILANGADIRKGDPTNGKALPSTLVGVALALPALGLALSLGGGAAGGSPQPVGVGAAKLSATLSTRKAHARPVVLTLRLRTRLVCGQPGTEPLVVRLPHGAALPAFMPRSSVLVDSAPAAKVSVASGTVSVTARPHKGVLCDVIGPGVITLTFTAGARLGNPASGSHTISVRRGKVLASTRVRIST
jgi:hypothetical protein